MWRKKIERDVSQGVPLDMFSVKAEKKKQIERMVCIYGYFTSQFNFYQIDFFSLCAALSSFLASILVRVAVPSCCFFKQI